MSAIKLWFDESGYTGEDLLNPDQRHFAVASTTVDNDEAAELLLRCFPRYAGAELKFTAVWRRESHRRGLLQLARALPQLGDRVFAFMLDKRFSLLIKLVDYLIEPMAYAAGRDFYRGGYGRRFVNTVDADLRRYGPPGLYDATIRAWNRVARDPGEESLAALKNFLSEQATLLKPPLGTFFGLVKSGLDNFVEPGERAEDFVRSNDLQLTAMLSSVSHWRTLRTEDFEVVHDESNNFFRDRSMWAALTRDDVEPQEVITGSGATVTFPLRVISTRAERSESSSSIQLCDLIAGMFTRAARLFAGGQDPFMMELLHNGLGDATFDGVMPQRERADGPPPVRNGPDMVDQMVGMMKPAIDEVLQKRRKAQEAGSS